MDLPPGMAIQVTQGDAVPVQQLHKVINERVENLSPPTSSFSTASRFGGRTSSAARNGKTSRCSPRPRSFSKASKPTTRPASSRTSSTTPRRSKATRLISPAEGNRGSPKLLRGISPVNPISVCCGSHASGGSSLGRRKQKKRTELLTEISKPRQRESETFKTDLLVS